MLIAANGSQWSIAGQLIKNQSVTANGKTFVAYQGASWHPYVVTYDHATQQWSQPVRAGTSTLANDSHGSPSIVLDAAGYLHVFYGCHATPIKHAKSAQPFDASSWISQASVTSSASYPNSFAFSGGRLGLFYRAGGHTAPWYLVLSADDGQTWGTPREIIHAYAPRMAFYVDVFQEGDNLHLGWVWKDDNNQRGSPGPEFTHRYQVYYAKLQIDGGLTNAAGASLPVPLWETESNNLCAARPLMTANLPHTNVPWVALQADGKPALLYIYGSGTTHSVYFTRWTGTVWQESLVCSGVDHLFDGYALRRNAANEWEAYVIRGGTAGTFGDLDATTKDRGGNLELWTSADGVSWQQQPTILSGRFNYPIFDEAAPTAIKGFVGEWTEMSDYTGEIHAFAIGSPPEPLPQPQPPTDYVFDLCGTPITVRVDETTVRFLGSAPVTLDATFPRVS